MGEIEDRRQRAREAGLDDLITDDYANMDAAIETATRVRITDEIIMAATENGSGERGPSMTMRERLRRAFQAAGFEVEG